jgi:putative ABC transport system permease protein
VVGDQAARAVAATPELTDADTATRSDWLAAQRAAPLTTGLPQLVVAAAVALGVLGVLVVLLGAETSAPERGRTLATLGLTGRQVRRITVGELLPPVLVATVVGTGLGAFVAGLAVALPELRRVTGQPWVPALVVPWWAPGAIVPLVLTVAAVVAVESSRRRRERLGEVLRVGGG